MNGEMYQICQITAAVKKALREHTPLHYRPLAYEHSVIFQLLARKTFFREKPKQAQGVQAWFVQMMQRGLNDVIFLTPLAAAGREFAGFANAAENRLVCFTKTGQVSCFTAQWHFDPGLKAWDILYTEKLMADIPADKPHFADPTKALDDILRRIADFAEMITADEFAAVFQRARHVLAEGAGEEADWMTIELPARQLRLFQAASAADVFGAMGSWNDSPPYLAHEKQLDQEYAALSDELFRQIRLAALYAVNEW